MRIGSYELRGEEQGIYTGDAKQLAEQIPDESIDLIFTDPDYWTIEDYRWLAKAAARVLKPDRACLAWAATPLLPQYLDTMIPPLEWAWLPYWRRFDPPTPRKSGICVVTLCLWLQKGNSKAYPRIADLIDAPQDRKNRVSHHPFSKPEKVVEKWMGSLTREDWVVWDPFTGEGVVPLIARKLGLPCLAFEIDEERAATARRIVEEVSCG